MPLTARHASTGEVIEAFSTPPARWARMKAEPLGTYVMRRNGAPAILKRNVHGTQWFAHPAGQGDPLWKPESREHIEAKTELVRALRAAGYEATAEEPGGATPGTAWEADVLCRTSGRTIAIEVQWSRQTFVDYLARTDRYALAGVKAVWLVRKQYFPLFQRGAGYHLGQGRGEVIAFPHVPEIPAFPLDFEEGPRVGVWPPRSQQPAFAWIPLAEFACGVAGGALVFSGEAKMWAWRQPIKPGLSTQESRR